ncbi:membrane protein insertase YidC [Fibrobacter sp.]|uniref:membrane protein insertase YidC n=1 Tax=Fibrobacter sp. TaxID=35828 RepID=UPI00388E0A8D
MNKNTIIGSIFIAIIVIWWMASNSAQAEAQAAAKAKAKEAAAAQAAEASKNAPAASELVLPVDSPAVKAPPVLGAAPAADVAVDSAKVATDSSAALASTADSAAQSAAEAAPVATVVKERTVTVETDKFIMTLTNKGGKVQSVIVKALADSTGKFPELIQDSALGALDLKLGAADLSEALFDVGDAPEWITVDGDTSVQFSFADVNGNKVVRSYAFTKTGAAVRQENKFEGFRPESYELMWKGGMKETEVFPEGRSFNAASYYFSEVIYRNNEITERETFKDAMTLDEANYYWVGLRRKYAAMSVQFDKPVPAKVSAKHFKVQGDSTADPGTYSLSIADELRGATSFGYNFMVLPLQWDEVESLGKGYEKVIVTGSKWFPGSSVWFVWICKWLLKLLQFLYQLIPNYGVAIILLTFIVRGITTPFTIKQIKAMRPMAELKPEIEKINVKYRSDPKAKQAAMMELYQKHGVNPMAGCTGCLPMLIQMPIFMGLFFVLGRALELRGMPAFLWISDLSRSDVVWTGFSIPYVMPSGLAILPWIMVVSTYFQTKVTMGSSAGMDPAQQKMMVWMMPAMMFFFSAVMPSGLVLYWIISNIWTIVQYKFINSRFIPAPAGSSKLNGKNVKDAEIVKKKK